MKLMQMCHVTSLLLLNVLDLDAHQNVLNNYSKLYYLLLHCKKHNLGLCVYLKQKVLLINEKYLLLIIVSIF